LIQQGADPKEAIDVVDAALDFGIHGYDFFMGFLATAIAVAIAESLNYYISNSF
jgi:hypothetical protein